MQKYIGIFDSGIGGLTVANQIIKKLPHEKIIYLGDTARVPYGIKSEETVIKFTCECINFLNRFRLKAIIIACNTASSYALPYLKSYLKMPIFGVIDPGIKKAVELTRNEKIGVIGTRATIHSQSYRDKLLSLDSDLEVFQQSCPLFVPLVEEGWLVDEVTYKVAEKYLCKLKENNIDTLILGCTHYPVLKKVISDIMGKSVQLIDSAQSVSEEVKKVLGERNLLSDVLDGKNKFFVTDEVGRFIKTGKLFFDGDLKEVSRVDLNNNRITKKVLA